MQVYVSVSSEGRCSSVTGEMFGETSYVIDREMRTIERLGYSVVCNLRSNGYIVKPGDVTVAEYKDRRKAIEESCAFVALVGSQPSEEVQTEIAFAIASGIETFIAPEPGVQLSDYNRAILNSGDARIMVLPVTAENIPF